MKVYIDKLIRAAEDHIDFKDLSMLFVKHGLFNEAFDIIRVSENLEDWIKFVNAFSQSDLFRLRDFYVNGLFFGLPKKVYFLHALNNKFKDLDWVKGEGGEILNEILEQVKYYKRRQIAEYYVELLILLVPILEKAEKNKAKKMAWSLSWENGDSDDFSKQRDRVRTKELLIKFATPEQIERLYRYAVENLDVYDVLLYSLFPLLKEKERTKTLNLLIDKNKRDPDYSKLLDLHMSPHITKEQRKIVFDAILELIQYYAGQHMSSKFETIGILSETKDLIYQSNLPEFWGRLDNWEVSKYWVSLNRTLSQYRRGIFLSNMDLFIPTYFGLNETDSVENEIQYLTKVINWWS